MNGVANRSQAPRAPWTGLLRAWLPVLAILLGALPGACSTRSNPRFPHAAHLAAETCGTPGKPACLSCNSCHAVSQRGRAKKLPEEALCTSCHRNDARTVLATLAALPERPTGEISFNHDRHLVMKDIGGQCVSCHAGVLDAARPDTPPMSRCFSCHEHQDQWDRGQCAPCHADKDLSRTLPRTFLQHDARFARGHGQFVLEDKRLCQSCHSEAQCNACHDITQDLTVEKRRPEAVERTFVHRGDFTVRHAIEAQAEPARCARCHTPESCDSCHLERGVSGNGRNGRNPHPPGWVGTNANSRSFHGIEARRDIVLCASCHEQGRATNCIRCHTVGGYGGNPHPGGWKSTLSRSDEMCRYCHE